MSLVTDLQRFARLISGRLIRVDGPFRNKRGIYYRCDGRLFRNFDAAVRHRDRHNQRVHREAAHIVDQLTRRVRST